MTDIPKQTLSELINNIKTKKISSEEATKAFIDRSEKSKKLNTYTVSYTHLTLPTKRIV